MVLSSDAAFVNGTRQGFTPEKPFKMGGRIAREMNPLVDAVPELHLESELALCTRTLQEVEDLMSQSTFSAVKQRQLITEKMKEFGMARYVSAELLTSLNPVAHPRHWLYRKEEISQRFLFNADTVKVGTTADRLIDIYIITHNNLFLCDELNLWRGNLFGWKNTYAFSKAVGEMVIDTVRGDIPVVVVRPSVVESTLAEPFPGWIEGLR